MLSAQRKVTPYSLRVTSGIQVAPVLKDVIEHGKNKDTKTKLKLMQRIYRRLAKRCQRRNLGNDNETKTVG